MTNHPHIDRKERTSRKERTRMARGHHVLPIVLLLGACAAPEPTMPPTADRAEGVSGTEGPETVPASVADPVETDITAPQDKGRVRTLRPAFDSFERTLAQTPAQPGPADPVASVQAPPNAGAHWTVQTSSWRKKTDAEQSLIGLKDRYCGVDAATGSALCGGARIECARVADKGVWYRVRVGQFADRTAAREVCQGLGGKCTLFKVTTILPDTCDNR